MGNLIHIGGRCQIFPDEVSHLKADVNYATVHFLDGNKIIVVTTLKTIEERLARVPYFYRVSKNTMVNLRLLDKSNPQFILLQNGEKLAPTRRRLKGFFERIEIVL